MRPISRRLTIDAGIAKHSTANSRALNFYYQGYVEEDPLKSFLFYFLSIEICVQKIYKQLNDSALDSFSGALPSKLTRSGVALIKKHVGKLVDLSDKFVACSLYLWDDIGDDEVDSFKKLKKTRDDIAHGNISDVPNWAVPQAQRLALKVLST